MFGVSEHGRRALFCSSFLKTCGTCELTWIVPVKNSIVTCHALAAHSSTLLPLKITRMQHVYEVYGNWINMAFVKGLLMHKDYREWKSEKNVLKQLPLYHTFPASLFVLVIPSLLVTLYHHEILSHPLWRNQK